MFLLLLAPPQPPALGAARCLRTLRALGYPAAREPHGGLVKATFRQRHTTLRARPRAPAVDIHDVSNSN